MKVERDDSSMIRRTVEERHYLRRWPDPRSLPFAYRLDCDGRSSDGGPWGLCVFKKPQHHRQAGLFGYPGLPTAWQVLDLARVWVHPDLQRKLSNGHSLCAFSRMLSLCLHRLQADWLQHHPPVFPQQPYHIALIISYCQLDHHDGTGYRASNFQRFGRTNDGAKDIYVYRLRTPRWKWRGIFQPMLLEAAP